MGKGSNALTHKQVYMLCKWIEVNGNRTRKISTSGLARIASRDLNFFVTGNNILRAMDIVGNSPIISTKQHDVVNTDGGGEEFVLDFSNGDSCTVQRLDDDRQTIVFLPDGAVVNSYHDRMSITIPAKDRIISIKSYDADIDLFEELLISRDQSIVSRSVTEQNVERL